MKAKVLLNGIKLETDFFDNFNWHKFNYGDDVHIEDDSTNYILAYFVTNIVTEDESVVYLTGVQ